MIKQKGYTEIDIIIAAIMILGVWGWIWNIIKIGGSDFGQLTGMLVVRCIGVFIAPLGAVLGFM